MPANFNLKDKPRSEERSVLDLGDLAGVPFQLLAQLAGLRLEIIDPFLKLRQPLAGTARIVDLLDRGARGAAQTGIVFIERSGLE